MSRAGIDIIIPVYNALEDLKLCVESVLRHTDLNVDRIVLIDDKSPDAEVYPYLQSIEQPGIVVLQNEINQGFSGTINRGLQYSERDVLLLNTDTIVTERWIDKIVRCAYSDTAIGTVTPFSNNATLCSIPNFCQENKVPYGLSIDDYARVIERCSLKRYPRITVAVGFCMFIKQETIERVGLFDQETFQRGYGEENDFCWRAEQLGYYHVLCDDTYVYHSGSSSFLSDEKKKLIAEHERIVFERYPKQHQENAEYVRDNPHQYLRTNVDIHAKLKNGKRNILYVLHMDFRADASNNVGGTQFHVKDLMMNLRQDNNVFVLARDGDSLRLTAYLEKEQIAFKFRVGTKRPFFPFHSKEIMKVCQEVLSAFDIDLVHVHHVMDMSFDIFQAAKEKEIPVLLTLHDFYYVCPTTRLVENGTTYCGGYGENCAECLRKQLGYIENVSYMEVWREKCRQVLSQCEALIAPSATVKSIYAKIYPDVAERIRVIPHGLDPFAVELAEMRDRAAKGFDFCIESAFEKSYCINGWALQEDCDSRDSEVFVSVEDADGNTGKYRALTLSRPDIAAGRGSNKYLYCGFTVRIPDAYFSTGKLKVQISIRNAGKDFYGAITTIKGYVKSEKTRKRIAFLGGLSEIKGSQLAYQMIKQSGNRYDWYIVGGIGDPDLITLEKSNVHKVGWYKREDVGAILCQNQIDLVCILSICPETFCYTLSESELAGIPVFATDIGALGERLRREQTGWLIAPGATGKQAIEALDRVLDDKENFKQVCSRVKAFKHRTIEDMCAEYICLYKDFKAKENRRQDAFDAQMIYSAYVMGQAEQSGIGFADDVDLIQRVNELEASLLAINQSLEYKMVKFFNRENMPFKRPFKWLIGVAYRVYKRLKR